MRGILLKANDAALLWPYVWPLLLLTIVVTTLALRRYRRTLDEPAPIAA